MQFAAPLVIEDEFRGYFYPIVARRWLGVRPVEATAEIVLKIGIGGNGRKSGLNFGGKTAVVACPFAMREQLFGGARRNWGGFFFLIFEVVIFFVVRTYFQCNTIFVTNCITLLALFVNRSCAFRQEGLALFRNTSCAFPQ